MDDVSRRIQERLTALSLSARAASLQSGLSERHVGKLLERGAGGAVTDTLRKLAPTLGVTVEWLASGDGPAQPPTELRMVPDGDARPSIGTQPNAEALAREIIEENPTLAPYVELVLKSGSMRSLDIPLTRSALETMARVVQSHGQRRGR